MRDKRAREGNIDKTGNRESGERQSEGERELIDTLEAGLTVSVVGLAGERWSEVGRLTQNLELNNSQAVGVSSS